MRIFLFFSVLLFVFCLGCDSRSPRLRNTVELKELTPSPFAFPIGKSRSVTESRDLADAWYNAQDFGENKHLGEDWNSNGGGNTECGEPVFATAAGKIVYAGDAGPGWGNVLIVTHLSTKGEKVQSLYGHLASIVRTQGNVKLRERIGTIGDANGRYRCHLHFEIRLEGNRFWDQVGPGYSSNRQYFADPSDFISKRLTR